MAAPRRDHDEHRRHPSTISQKVLNHRKMRRRMKRNDQRFLQWDVSGILRRDEEIDDDEAPTTIPTPMRSVGAPPTEDTVSMREAA